MIYSGDKASDVNSIWGFCWKHFVAFGMEPGQHLADAREQILQIVDDMYDRFPGDDIKNANPFKLGAWFVTCFLYYRPITKPFDQKITGFEADQNSLIAYNTIIHSLVGCQIFKDNGEKSIICDLPDKMLSKHSFLDIVHLFLEWENISVHKKDQYSLVNFYQCLTLLLEQITYRTLPAISYPRQHMLPSAIVGD